MHAPGLQTIRAFPPETSLNRASVVTLVDGAGTCALQLFGFALGAFLDAHVLEFAGFENFTALETLHEFSVFVAAHDLHARMFAGLLGGVLRLRKRLRGHKYGNDTLVEYAEERIRGNFPVILALLCHLSSASTLQLGKFLHLLSIDPAITLEIGEIRPKESPRLNHSIADSYHSMPRSAASCKHLRNPGSWT
jgi:hypothetical protein